MKFIKKLRENLWIVFSIVVAFGIFIGNAFHVDGMIMSIYVGMGCGIIIANIFTTKLLMLIADAFELMNKKLFKVNKCLLIENNQLKDKLKIIKKEN